MGCVALVSACTPAAAPAPLTAAPVPTAAPTVASKPAIAPTVASKPIAVKAAWVAKTANQMLWPVAKDAGYFDKYGVSFDLNYINGSTTGIAAMVAKDIDVAEVAGTAIIGGQAGGQDIVMIAGFLNTAMFRIMGGDDVKSIDDVKGKTVAVTRVGQADYFAWQMIVKTEGWTQDDIKYVNSNDVQGQVGLLQQGQVTAIAVTPPNNVLALRAGAHEVLDTATLNIPQQNVGFGVLRSYLQESRPAVLGIMKATVEAMARWKEDPAFTKGVIQKYLESSDPQFTDVGYEAYKSVWPQAPYVTRDGLKEVIGEVAVQNPKAKDLALDQMIDDSVVKELEDTGFIKQIYG